MSASASDCVRCGARLDSISRSRTSWHQLNGISRLLVSPLWSNRSKDDEPLAMMRRESMAACELAAVHHIVEACAASLGGILEEV